MDGDPLWEAAPDDGGARVGGELHGPGEGRVFIWTASAAPAPILDRLLWVRRVVLLGLATL